MATNTTTLYPAWKEALTNFIKRQFALGEVVPTAWFYEQFGLQQPTPTTTYEEAKKNQFLFRGAFEHLQTVLLEDYQIALRNHFGEGYSIVPPKQQAQWALAHVVKDAKKAFKKGAVRMTNVDVTTLDMSERADQADCLTRLAAITGFLKEQTRLPKK